MPWNGLRRLNPALLLSEIYGPRRRARNDCFIVQNLAAASQIVGHVPGAAGICTTGAEEKRTSRILPGAHDWSGGWTDSETRETVVDGTLNVGQFFEMR